MAKKKLNAFNDRNAKEITTEDVEGLLKMQKEAKDKADYEANKADYKAPKYNSLPTLDDTSRKVSTKAPSASPEQPKTMNVGNKTFKVTDNAKKTSIDSGKKLATGKKDEQTEYYNKQIEKRNNLKRSESSLGNYGWEGSLKSIRNKQIAKTDKELSSSYINDVNNEKEVNGAVDKWLNPEYKMTDFERKQAQKLTNDYFKKFNKATGGATKSLKGEEKKRYDRMNELATKSNKASAAVMGSADALGAITLGKGLNKALDKEMAKEVNQRIDKEQEVARRQSPLAYNAGYMGTKMGEYAMLNNALGDIPALSNLGKVLNSGGGLTKDMFADLLLDTTFETAENAVNGESLGKVSADTAKNIGANIVFNMLPELLGGALKSANPEIADDVVKNISEAMQNEVPKVDPDTSFVDFANELTNREMKVNPYVDNSQKAIIDKLRAENPQLLGKLSDEDILAFDRANTGADVLNQNYETLRNVMNNTDQPTRAIADNGGNIPSALDIMPNEASGNYKVIQDFRTQNPALAQNMSDRDIMNYLNTPKSMPSLEKPIANEVTEEVAKEAEPAMTAIDYDNAVRDLSERYSIANEVDDLVSDDLAKAITFDSDADREAFEEVYNAFLEDSKNIMNAKNHSEIVDYIRRIDEESRALDNLMGKGYVLDKGSKKELQRIKKNFYDNTRGTVIRLTPDLRHEMGLDGKTIAELNNELRLGKNGIRFSANNGTPIDMLFDELKQASGNAMRDADNSADQINALMEYVESLKNGEAAKMRVGARDLIDEDLFDVLSENVGAYDDALAKLGVRPEGEGLPIREEVPDNITNIFDEEPAVRYMAEDTGIGKSTKEIDDAIGENANDLVDGNNVITPNAKFNLTELTEDPGRSAGSISVTDNLRERGLAQHIRGDETPMKVKDVSEEVIDDFRTDKDMYRQLKNSETRARAEEIYNDPNIDTEKVFNELLEAKDPASLPLGTWIAKDYSAAGDHKTASLIYRRMGEKLTEAGQFSQAAVISMMKNDPLTALYYAERQIDKLNENGAKQFGNKWKDFSLTDDEIKMFNDIAPGDEEAIKNAYDVIGARLGKEYPTTFMDKLLEGRKIAMLFNVRTNVRNVGANIPTLGLRWVSDRVEALGQNFAHLLNPDIKVTQSVTGSGREGRKLATEVFNSKEVQAMLNNQSGKYEIPELKNSLVQNKQMYKGTALSKWIDRVTDNGIQKVNEKLFGKKGVQSGLETIRNATYKMLDLGDSPFVKENFVERLGSYIKAQGIKNIEDIPNEAIQTAWEEAMKATYKDNSWAVQMLRGLKGGLEKIPGVGKVLSQAAIPFLQAPGNIAARMIDYSPVKATKGIVDIISGTRANDVKVVSKGIEEAAKGLTGSGLILLGMRLRDSGIITGTYSSDKDQKAYEKQNGFKEFALHVGDKYFTYDWAQPFAEPLIIGTLLSDAINKSDEYDSDLLDYFGVDNPIAKKALGVAYEGGKAALNSWFNASPLQGLQELLSGGFNSDDIAQNIIDTGVSDFAGAFVPASVNAVAKSMDTTQRNTYDPSNKVSTFVNQQIAKIPKLSETLPAKYDTWGREMKYADSKAMATASRFVIPGDYSYDKSDKIDKEIMRLYEGTEGDATVFPQVAPDKVGDKKLNNKEVSEYQKDMGTRSRQLAEEFINSDVYKDMDDADRAEVLSNMYGASKAITERDKFGKEPAESSKYKKAIEVYDNAGGGEKGAQAMAKYLYAKDVLSTEAEQFKNKKGEGKDFSDLSKEENLKVLTDMVNNGYMTKEEAYDYLPDNKMVNTLSQYGNKGYELYADLVQYGTKDGKFSTEKVMSVLRGTNTDPEIAGSVLYAMNGSKDNEKLNTIKSDLGYEGVWDYYNYKEYANLDHKDNITKKELITYLDGRDMDRNEKYFWFDMLKSGSNVKNPY